MTTSVKNIIGKMDGLLKPLGFERRKTTWNRRDGSMIDVMDIQVSKERDEFTINAGVMDPEVHAILWDGELQEFVEQPMCTVGIRIGDLTDGLDVWWRLDDANAPVDICNKIANNVIPFMHRMHERRAMRQWLVETNVVRKRYPPPILGLAIVAHLLGEKMEACSLLREYGTRMVGAWRDRADKVSRQLGCEG